MNFSFSSEQDAFRREARRFLSEQVDARAQIAMPGAHDPALWKEMAALGWVGAAIPEEHGGQGLPFVDLCLLVEETGRALLPGPFLPHTIASLAIARAGTDAQRADLLPSLASGGAIGAFTEDGLLATCGAVADVVAILEFARPQVARSGGFDAEPVDAVDLTRPAARITLLAEAEPLGAPVPLRPCTSVLIAAESVGAASAAMDMAVAYAKERIQFDRPIGSFQAIKHKAADMLRALEAARLAVYYAASAIEAGDARAHVAAAMAKASANDAFTRCAADNIQIHGGIGVTWEHDAHLFYRRALASSPMFGDPSAARDHVARALFEELDDA
ncbi:MAG: acyl-CoA dehydrogenase family protein [Actinomycetota bacterium]